MRKRQITELWFLKNSTQHFRELFKHFGLNIEYLKQYPHFSIVFN